MQFESVFCVASGPSLTKADCEKVERSGIPVVAVNNAYGMFRQPYALFAGDLTWWDAYGADVPKHIRRCSASEVASQNHGVEYQRFGGRQVEFNSGSMAIQFAASLGAKTVYLLGYDCSVTHGAHFHGRHQHGLRNPTANSVANWQQEFSGVQRELAHVEIFNCSRRTELACFPLKSLETVIA